MSEIQAGRQKGRVVSARLDTTQSGKPYVRVTFALDGGGEIAADVWLTTPKALSMARARLRTAITLAQSTGALREAALPEHLRVGQRRTFLEALAP